MAVAIRRRPSDSAAERLAAGPGARQLAASHRTLTIEMWPISRIKPYESNARKIPFSAVDKVATSLREFGWRQPIVVDVDGVIVVGHARRLGAIQNGWTEAPVHVASDLTAEQIKAYRLADNRSHEESGWDIDKLSSELLDLKSGGYDLALTGFTGSELNQMTIDGAMPQWTGMPDFSQDDLLAWQTVKVHFASESDREQFAQLLGQPITDKTKSLWYPKAERAVLRDKRFVSVEHGNPRYPVYIVSKGRAESRLTSKALEKIGVPYHIVIEPQELEAYAAVIDREKILVLPFSNLGQGSIPSRNWIWEHSISIGAGRHWIMDDNIDCFYRLVDNQKLYAETGAIFRASEDFVDRYTNIALAGLNYDFFAKRKQKIPPFVSNTRIYSCILIKNDLPYRWRGRYNEDTDLSLRALKDGWCTVQFNAFLAGKAATMTMKGGNTDQLYTGDGRRAMAESLREQHPDVVTVAHKFNRWQHQVDYRPFRKNKFISKPGFEPPTEANNYGMELQYV